LRSFSNGWQPEVLVAYASMMRLLAEEQLAGRPHISLRADPRDGADPGRLDGFGVATNKTTRWSGEMAGYDIKYWCPLCGADGNVHGKDKDEAVEKLEEVEEKHEKRMGHRGFVTEEPPGPD
jgi:hypothetical protein